MNKNSRAADRAITKIVKLTNAARNPYTYFIVGEATYRWHLCDRDGNELCSSREYLHKEQCLAALRATQHHAATADIRDDTR